MIFLDTSVLVESFTGSQPLLNLFRAMVGRNERLALSSIVLHEWLRGPRFPDLPEECDCTVWRGRSRHRRAPVSIRTPGAGPIAACAIRLDAELCTLNVADFKDIRGLRLIQ